MDFTLLKRTKKEYPNGKEIESEMFPTLNVRLINKLIIFAFFTEEQKR